jgi:hypothetical protein
MSISTLLNGLQAKTRPLSEHGGELEIKRTAQVSYHMPQQDQGSSARFLAIGIDHLASTVTLHSGVLAGSSRNGKCPAVSLVLWSALEIGEHPIV